jgi:hypothetical protein
VLEEFHVKDADHKYRYTVFCEDGCAAFQFADTFEEMWAKLYKSRGPVAVKDGEEWIFHGTTEEAREWCLRFREARVQDEQKGKTPTAAPTDQERQE